MDLIVKRLKSNTIINTGGVQDSKSRRFRKESFLLSLSSLLGWLLGGLLGWLLDGLLGGLLNFLGGWFLSDLSFC